MVLRSTMFEGVTPFDILMRDEYSDMNLVIGVNIIAVHRKSSYVIGVDSETASPSI